MKFLSILAALFLLTSGTAVDSYFVWLDWDANAPSDNVLYYTLYMGEFPNVYPAKMKLGNQTSARVLRNHYHTYASVSASNSFGEGPKSNEVHVISQ